MIFQKIIAWWRSLRYYVIADPADNSVTLSKALFRHMKNNVPKACAARVFVFAIPANNAFGFMVNPEMKQPTQLCDIQYNDKYRCVGFETLCPSVGRILYDYGMNGTLPVKLSVTLCRTSHGETYYQFDKPHAKHIGKYSQTRHRVS